MNRGGEFICLVLIWLQLREMNRRACGEGPVGAHEAVVYAALGLYVAYAAFRIVRELVLAVVREAFQWAS